MNRSETKFHNTAVKFDQAFLELLDIKEFADISIKDICEKAGTNRSTFYLHYENTYDLLKETQRYIMDSFIKSFGEKSIPKNLDDIPKEQLNFVSPEYIVPYLLFIKQNKTIFKVYLQNMRIFDVDAVGDFFFKEVFIPIMGKHGLNDKTIISYAMKYYLTGITAIVAEWVKREFTDDTLFLCEIINSCVRPV